MSGEEDAKSRTITFRLNSTLINEIRKDAQFERTNINALVSKILSNHILWERYERKVGLLPMTKPFVKYAIEKMDAKEIIHFAEVIEQDTVTDIFNFMKTKYTTEDFIEILRTWLYVAWMQHVIIKGNDTYTFKIKHDLGEKWSLYVKTFVTKLFHDILEKRLNVKTTKNTITLIFPVE
ncbi:hypothetical protein Nlim_0950 [Candidatus Nitrosarchaeum limnium SFB1]|jgi:hypothetical protein|uniref:Uncharacterized protein n=1 Tax=Candidatus Nitrosarchaeum limnium SFB1 TaxID=886738 RepID=F3KKD5_9ARCH|nr:hypothetical protein Nlim_0950 [Candidatus Nitrosarchaeum limnium SFB1]